MQMTLFMHFLHYSSGLFKCFALIDCRRRVNQTGCGHMLEESKADQTSLCFLLDQ